MNCPVCLSPSAAEFSLAAGVKYFECNACGSLFADPDFLGKIDAGAFDNSEGNGWRFGMASSKERSFGSSVIRVAEVFFYSRICIENFVDISSASGFLLDALSAVLPSSRKIFQAVGIFSPQTDFQTCHKDFNISAIGGVGHKFQAGCCIDVIEHLTPTMLERLLIQLAQSSDGGAIYYFESGQPEYVKNEDPGYLNPFIRGNIISYSVIGLSKVFARHGFNLIPLPGRAWAFLAEFGPVATYTDDDLLTRLWTALPENLSVLKDPQFGPLMYTMGLESARCYLEASMSRSRAEWALTLQAQVQNFRSLHSSEESRSAQGLVAQDVIAMTPDVQASYFQASVSPATFYPFPSRREAAPADVIEGICPVCGADSKFSGFTSNLRESGTCSRCGSFNRQRQMAFAIRQAYGLPRKGALRLPPELSIYNTETTGAVHQALKIAKNYYASEYFGEEFLPGEDVGGRKNEDLQRLSLRGESVDLVLSSDVLEHMPSPYVAHQEILRVLRPGGRHIFTVPFNSSVVKDDIRSMLIDGAVHHLAPPLFHGDPVRPDEGVLVWTIFGLEMLVKLADLGFEVFAWDAYCPSLGILGETPIVFEARKPLQVKC